MIMFVPGTDVYSEVLLLIEMWSSDRLASNYDMTTLNQVLAADSP